MQRGTAGGKRVRPVDRVLYVILAAGVIAGLTVRGLAITYNWSLPSFGAGRR